MHSEQLPSQDASKKIPDFSKTNKLELDPIKTDAHIERAWVAAILDEQIEDPAHTTSSENEPVRYGNDIAVIMRVARQKINGLIAEEVDGVKADHTEAEVQILTIEYFVNICQLHNSASSKKVRITSVQFLGMIVVDLLRIREAGDLR